MPPVERPNSAEKVLRRTWNSCSASMLNVGENSTCPHQWVLV